MGKRRDDKVALWESGVIVKQHYAESGVMVK